MIQRLRESLTLILIALLPFHALIVTVKTLVIAGPGHAPLTLIALWKEALLALILGVAVLEVRKWKWKIDVLDWIIIALLILSVIVTAATHGNWNLYTFGFRYDFVPLIAFLILRRVSWSDLFVQRAIKTIITVGVVVAVYALLTLLIPESFFQFLGYSDLHSLYIPNRPIAAFQMIGETGLRRIQGPMSGPNQLGIWLLIPIALAIGGLRVYEFARLRVTKHILLLCILLLALVLTFSRAAWIGAFVIFCIAFLPVLRSWSKRRVVGIAVGVIGISLLAVLLFPSVLLRLSSTRGHIQGPIEAVHRMIAHPFGMGLGMAGPASNRVSDACVLLRETDDASWAQAHPNLCVFLGNTQVQPVDRACSCPFLPENWYLQIGVEMGWLGLALYLVMMGLVMSYGWTHNAGLITAFIGISTAALFLHAFEDAAIAYTLWVLVATSPLRLNRSQ